MLFKKWDVWRLFLDIQLKGLLYVQYSHAISSAGHFSSCTSYDDSTNFEPAGDCEQSGKVAKNSNEFTGSAPCRHIKPNKK